MKDVIERMLQVEEEGRRLLADAEKQAASAAESARRKATEKAEALRAEAHAEASKRLESARAEMQAKRDERLAAFDRDNAEYAEKVRPHVPEAAEQVVKRVLGG